MKLKLIKTDQEYNKILKRLDEIFHSVPGTKENDELEILVMLITKYENEKVGEFRNPDPIEAIKFKMEQMDLSQKDLSNILGLKSRASEILSKKRKMSISIIRKLNEALNISADILIQDYELAN